MKKGSYRMLLMLGLALATGACSTPRVGLLTLYQSNSGDIINLHVGEEMDVVLDGDPGTEIHWIKVPGDPDILRKLGNTEYKPDLESHQVERKLTTRFQATAPGRARLKLNYRVPGAPSQRGTRITPDRTFEVWVVVKDQG